MLSYLHEMTQNESYLQILPESILSFFNSLESTLQSILQSSFDLHSSSSPLDPSSSQPSQSSKPSRPTQSPDPSLPISTVILVDDRLVQQHSLLQ